MEVDDPQLAMELASALRHLAGPGVRRGTMPALGPADQRPPPESGRKRRRGTGCRDQPKLATPPQAAQASRQRVGRTTIGIGYSPACHSGDHPCPAIRSPYLAW